MLGDVPNAPNLTTVIASFTVIPRGYEMTAESDASKRTVSTLLRMSPDKLDELREKHASTRHVHRLSFNAWLLSRIELSFKKEPQ